ncbi:hypothetical protein LZ617_24470 [Escherichia coli]|uniref:MrpH family fimbial adhesin n=1 Tax=Escherichia coli TaxID=562 RepID=UPI001F47E68B|nr:hypothetical protein [Escherichia coli]MCE9976075.1 hypothetical protein [Escherichia coli]MCE9989534.1 hypothetical protein [Escherichia coli]
MKGRIKKIFILLWACFISKAIAIPSTEYGPTFVIRVSSWLDDYQTEVVVPDIVYDDSIIRISLFAAHKPFFNGSLHHTYGSCEGVPDNNHGMAVQNVLAIPRRFESNGVTFEYIGAEGADQIINMFDGSIGLMSQGDSSPYRCKEYLDMVGQGDLKGWFGSGKKVVALYKIVRLPEVGVRDYVIPTDSYFMRVARGSSWQNMGSLKGFANNRQVPFRMRITASCTVETRSLDLEHGILTPDRVNNNEVSKKIVLQCSGGGRGNAKLSLSNHLSQNLISLGNNIKTQLSLSSDSISIERDGRREVLVTSKLLAEGNVNAGKFEGNDVLTVLWQ